MRLLALAYQLRVLRKTQRSKENKQMHCVLETGTDNVLFLFFWHVTQAKNNIIV